VRASAILLTTLIKEEWQGRPRKKTLHRRFDLRNTSILCMARVCSKGCYGIVSLNLHEVDLKRLT
jgi:hypothetical protein